MKKENHLTEKRPEHAVEFVNMLVPGRFELARSRLASNCEYHYSGKVLRGDAIIDAFEVSHEKAKKELDRIDYLPASVNAIEGDTIVVGVSDRIKLKGDEHVYSDRLAIDVLLTDSGWFITRIEHRPFAEERRKLHEFLETRKISE